MNAHRPTARTPLLALLLLTLLTPLSGCLAIAAATATGLIVAYNKGDTEAVVTDDIAGATAVAEQTLDGLGYSVIKTERKDAERLVTARTPTDKKIKVSVSSADDPRHVRVAARVETFGDDAISGQIITAIVDSYRE